ncbi:DUF4890 domain-containing protein [Rufibacter sediminis]|uniref:DUF4890 domain-containing protein n=1 Tax=Rufibacter sediminis TaxID=2762756 RepID=A0ABR6VQ81_9BACT|nr:DUF4890 domain-containing protein [Rufibacter sediminis]MBC3539356.1 DUF4890 domain-containing protein [Rufibacter sediminis]
MKKLVAMMALGLAVAGTSYAQTTPQQGRNAENRVEQGRRDRGDFRRGDDKRAKVTPEQRATKRTEMLTKKLGLNKSQERKLQELNLKQAQQLESLKGQFAQGKGRNEQGREQMQRLRADWEKEFKSIVNKKQYAQYEADRKQMQANRANRKGKDGARDHQSRRQQNG